MGFKLKFLLLIVLLKSFDASEPIEISCKYGTLTLSYVEVLTFYSCKMQNDFPYLFDKSNPIVVSKIDAGNHTADKTDASVTALEIVSKNIFQIPNLSTTFNGIVCIKVQQATKLRYLVKENIGVYKGTLKHLIITNSGIEIIDRNIFDGMTLLETIDLQDNQIFYIDTDVFKFLPLKILNLKGNKCEDFDLNPIENFIINDSSEFATIISTLRTSSCILHTAKFLLDKYKTTLTKSDSDSYNELEESEIHLKLNDEKISNLTEDIRTANGEIEIITGLYSMANNKIVDLMDELKSTNMTAEIYKSKAESFEKSIKQMKKEVNEYELTIEDLELMAERCLDVDGTCRYTNITAYDYTCIAHNINIMTPGQEVNWTGTHISKTLTNVNVLTVIIKDIHAEYIPRKIGATFGRLENLIVKNCGLTKLLKDDFLDMDYVTNLEITSNNISTIDSGVFDKLYALKTLDLSQNQIKSLPSKIFVELDYLSTLKLDENQLTSLKADFLVTPNSVKYFSATKNKFAKIDSQFVFKLRSAIFIDFSGNGCDKKFNETAGENYLDFYMNVVSNC